MRPSHVLEVGVDLASFYGTDGIIRLDAARGSERIQQLRAGQSQA